jgi:(p)ppGpp synthase/HD superfamily hydrolase
MMVRRFGEGSNEVKLIMHAADAIRDTHRGKKRRKNEDSRLVHEREMAGIADYYNVTDWRIYVTIFTHDGPEDYQSEGWTFERLERDYDSIVRNNVEALTNPVKPRDMSDHDYNMKLVRQWRNGGREVVLVKSIDRLHGLLNPWKGGKRRMVKKQRETIRYLLPLMVEFDLTTYPIITAIGILDRKYGLQYRPIN